jgi:hypothetical protein
MIKPQNVKSPKQHWVLIDVLIETPTWSLSVGEWDGARCLAARWNGDPEHPKGSPVSHGMPTWFILPDAFVAPLLAADLMPSDKSTAARGYLRLSATARSALDDLPSHDLGAWPEGMSLRREDLYGDDGR